MNKIIKILLLLFFALFLLSNNIMAAPFNTRPVAVNTPGSEPSLQTILDNVVGASNLNVIDDQSEAALWQPSDIDTSTYTVAMFTSNDGMFGIYSPSTNTQVDLLSVSPVVAIDGDVNESDPMVSFFISGGILSFGGSSYTGFNTFGFYWRPNDVNLFTEDSRNSEEARALAYQLAGITEIDLEAYIDYTIFNALVPINGKDDWILAFEDFSDNDYQDAVFFLEDMSAVPEPATMLLLGSGLIGLAGIGRRKLFKK